MDLFCFASRSLENIWLGVRARRWAVATVSNPQMRTRRTKAEKYLFPGSPGTALLQPHSLVHCSIHRRIESGPPRCNRGYLARTMGVPFHINPLGDPRRQVPAEQAWQRWPILRRRQNRAGGVSAAMNITGTTVFVPVYRGLGCHS
jgi:hypothetical protein